MWLAGVVVVLCGLMAPLGAKAQGVERFLEERQGETELPNYRILSQQAADQLAVPFPSFISNALPNYRLARVHRKAAHVDTEVVFTGLLGQLGHLVNMNTDDGEIDIDNGGDLGGKHGGVGLVINFRYRW